MKPIDQWLSEMPRSNEQLAAYHKIRDSLLEITANMRSLSVFDGGRN